MSDSRTEARRQHARTLARAHGHWGADPQGALCAACTAQLHVWDEAHPAAAADPSIPDAIMPARADASLIATGPRTGEPDDPAVFDWQRCDYDAVILKRAKRLERLRADPALLAATIEHYKHEPGGYADFIHDWAVAPDPRNIGAGRSALVPFILMPRQRQMVEFILMCWRNREPGLIEKSRDAGASHILMMLACTLCLFNRDLVIGVGSAKEDLADRSGDPNSLLHKARSFLQYLPAEFLSPVSSAHMRLAFTATGSAIVAEAGDHIGRGGRSSLFFLDESAHIEHPKLVDAALSANTDVRIDISSVSGMANSFAERRHSGKIPIFTMHWRDDLRKDDAWAAKKRAEVDEVTWNAEYDLNYLASVPGVLLQPEKVRACIDAHKKLGIEPTGVKSGALDPADKRDTIAFVARQGIVVTYCEAWRPQRGSDLFDTTEKAYGLADTFGLAYVTFDATSLGAGVRAAVNKIAERRRTNGQRAVTFKEFMPSGAVGSPDAKARGTDVKNKDRFHNLKAQWYFGLRDRIENTWRAVNGATDYDPDNLISFSSAMPDGELNALCVELSIPVWRTSGTGKIIVEKYGAEGNEDSPGRADAIMMLMGQPHRPPMKVDPSVVRKFQNMEPPASALYPYGMTHFPRGI
jgi:phage terminase large subunit